MRKIRLDALLIQRGFAFTEKDAFLLVTEGRVFANGQKAVSPAQMIGEGDRIEVRDGREFVGRGAYKLEAAIEKFGVEVDGKICADIGSAAGGFTEVLLKHGAKKVYAIDVGRGKLDLKLREDPRVAVMEGVNVLYMDALPEQSALITIDVSFTPLRLVLPKIRPWLLPRGAVIALFKPQYEIEDKSLLKHGIVEDAAVRERVLADFRAWLGEHNWRERGFMESPIRGSEGNVEYLFCLKPSYEVLQ